MPDPIRARPEILWLGGSACAGKSTVARVLADAHGLTLYSCDDHFSAHRQRADPARFPAFHRLAERSAEVLWTGPVEDRVDQLVAFYEDEFHLVVDDLGELAGATGAGGRVLVEGAGLLPWRVLPLCRDPHRALWLVADPRFRRRRHGSRGPWVQELLRDAAAPAGALERWMERDDRYGAVVAAAALKGGGRVVTVDGSLDPRRMAGEVARRFRLESGGPSTGMLC